MPYPELIALVTIAKILGISLIILNAVVITAIIALAGKEK